MKPDWRDKHRKEIRKYSKHYRIWHKYKAGGSAHTISAFYRSKKNAIRHAKLCICDSLEYIAVVRNDGEIMWEGT